LTATRAGPNDPIDGRVRARHRARRDPRGLDLGDPGKQLAARLPTTTAKARALVARTAQQHHVPVSGARAAVARAPYRRAPLRYLFAAGWIDGRRSPASCVLAKAGPGSTEGRIATSIRRDRVLVARLARMNVTVPQAAKAVLRGTASAC
jgi:hypothetical protein